MDKEQVVELMLANGYEVDNENQVVFYSGWYVSADGTQLQDQPTTKEEGE